MNCHDVEPHILDVLSGGPVGKDISSHIESCSNCKAVLQELKETDSMLRQSLFVKAPASMRTSFYEQLAQLQTEAPSKAPFWGWQSLRAWRPIALAGSLIVVFFIGYGAAMQRTSISTGTQPLLVQLQSSSSAERLAAVYSSIALEPSDTAIRDALLLKLRTDSNVNVRVAAIEALTNYAEHQRVREGVYRALFADDSPNVQMSAMHFASAKKPAELEAVVSQFLIRPDLESQVRIHANSLLNRTI